MNLTPHDNLGLLCDACGAPLRQRDRTCPRCGHGVGRPDELAFCLMTPFGWGFCGLMSGLIVGFAVLTGQGPLARSAWLPPLLGTIAAVIAAQVGKRLLPQLRCSYEHLLLSFIAGGICALLGALASPLGFDTLGLLWLAGVTAAYLLLRRHGYRPR